LNELTIALHGNAGLGFKRADDSPRPEIVLEEWAAAEGGREKAEGRREKAEGRRQKGE
jgi:hypothetical protein